MTTPEQQPVLHYWHTLHEAAKLPAEQIVEQQIAVGQVMTPALAAVIVNHLETRTPVVLEGDFILPTLAAQSTFAGMKRNNAVRGVFLYEGDEAQLVANFFQREPESGPQHKRARVSWLYGQWFKQQAEQNEIAVIEARPWDTVFERIVAALQ
jgi:2-phosphoglycerate kinase